ncbi:MAG: TonB-dependent receptor [Chitinophagaceae bacterium]|nr:TonB-dependent receptor [Chitinophagaceae bacterium]
MKYFFVLLLSISGTFCSFSQDCDLRISGHVEDADTKEKLYAATVLLKELNKEITTNENGDFVFTLLCPGEYTLYISHISCDPVEQKIRLDRNRHQDIFLDHARKTLGAVVVEAQKGIPNTGFKQELAGKMLDESKGQSLAQALSKLNGVSMLQTGSTVSKPVIHGLHSNRILTINNGVRQEGQQWGNEHAPEIDPFIADKLTVIKGVDELKYGSDAIAGVILVNPKPLRHTAGYYGELNTGYFSNDRQYYASLLFEQQLKKISAFSYRMQGTFKKAANISTPDYRLNNTALQEANFSLTAGWKKRDYDIEAFYSQFNTQIGIFSGAHVGNLTDLRYAISAARPNDIYLGEDTYKTGRPYQDVTHRLFKIKSNIVSGFGKFHIQVAAQHNRRQEYDIVRDAERKGAQMRLAVLTLSEDISWDHPSTGNLNGTVGISAMQQDNSYGGRYFIPAYTSSVMGGYWIEKWAKHKWEIQGGIRYDYKNINTTRYPYNSDPLSYSFNYSTVGASFNTIYKIKDQFKINAGVTMATRAPYVNELLSDGIHQGTGFYETGFIDRNTISIPEVKPEQSFNVMAGMSFGNKASTFSAEVTLYNNMINHFIYLQPSPGDTMVTVAGTFLQAKWKQTDARLTGVDLALNYRLSKQITLASRTSLLRAYNRTLDDWQIGMPADRTTPEITYDFNDKGIFSKTYISVEAPVVFKQTRVPDERKHGVQDYKAPPAGYVLMNLNASTTIRIGKTIPITIGLSARNLLNKSYREYMNSFRYFTDEMGRNIGIRLKVPLEKTS